LIDDAPQQIADSVDGVAGVGGQPSQRNFLFLCGVPRSGTTAFAELLNRHPKIAVGIERFKFVAMRRPRSTEFCPQLFERDRFFDFRETDTNVRAEKIYRRMAADYDQAKWVGDKVPRYYVRLRTIYDRFPGCMVFYIVRDLASVANSWNVRAQNANDTWPARNDYRRAVFEWNKGNGIALRWARRRPNHFHVVTYDELFPFGIDLLTVILSRLELDPEPLFLKQYKAFIEAPRRPPSPKTELAGQAEYLDEHADLAMYRKLLRRRLTA
jgi:Sulfotransferase family